MPITDIAPPDIEPITLDYAKTFLRVDTDDDDALIMDLIRSARLRVEVMINGALISRLHRMTRDDVAARDVSIHYHPVQSIEALRLLDNQGGSVELSLDELSINLRCQPPKITLKNQLNWHSILPAARYLEIDFTAGFGESADEVPMPLRQAVMLLLAQSYEFRGDSDAPSTPMLVDALLMPYRVVRL